jgi:UDP-N-acetylmuramate dehydrogenase
MTALPKSLSLMKHLPKVRGRYEPNAALKDLIWFRTGGPAEVLFRPADEADLAGFLKNLSPDVPVHVIGIGSNLIVRDGGVRGVVIQLGKAFGDIAAEAGRITAGAGATDVAVGHRAAAASLAGLEFLRGIPGTVGGALRMNAGAYGAEVADVLVGARALDRKGNVHDLAAADMGFSYRSCGAPKDWIFVSATFQGKPGEAAAIRARMDEIQKTREATQPMRVKTGGSTFKNPPGAKAWKLIEQAGCRGLTRGGAQVSPLHCNFLINTGNATSLEIEELGEEIMLHVKKIHNIDLQWEIEKIGEGETCG